MQAGRWLVPWLGASAASEAARSRLLRTLPRAPGRIQTCAHGFGGRRPSARDLARCPPLTMPRKQMADGPVSRSRTTIRVQHGRPTHDRGRRPERRRCARRRCRDGITECVPSARTQRRCVRSASPILPLPDSVIAPPAARLDNRHRGMSAHPGGPAIMNNHATRLRLARVTHGAGTAVAPRK